MTKQEEFKYISNKFLENKQNIASNMFQLIEEHYEHSPAVPDVLKENLGLLRLNLVEMIAAALLHEEDAAERVSLWAEEVAESNVRRGLELDTLLHAVSFYRASLWEIFEDDLQERKISFQTLLEGLQLIDRLLDSIIFAFSRTYVDYQKRNLELARQAVDELSVPIVPISSEIGVLPLVGEIDTKRASLIMNHSLSYCTKLRLKHLFIDLSGVPVMDTMVANYIFQVSQSLRLIGVETTITGIRPEIAQTVIGLGIDFRSVETRANLKQALAGHGYSIRPS
ncbi:STAS domain-containing protein [Bacillus lacus]|uniref:STAS domain-containing protein n=1 Tax=Metabacillus lacus TaxID=1983721 RepID=A0A7X2IZC0_9BACI|nr:STAS domain-containing protein [Metabacillus lacus]MRX71938.1 STAS domain-containing protein [Metabacillus lacus]